MTSAAEEAGVTTTPLKGIRRTAARRMVSAWEAPVFHLSVEVDMTAALGIKTQVPGATVTDVLLSACAQSLAAHPGLNAHYADEAVTSFRDVNLGIAVASPAGLMVPVIHNVQRLGIADLAEARREVVDKARNSKLAMADVTGGTFTISNLGMMGIDRFDAILNVPQVAILAVGSTRQRQVWNDGDPAWRPIADMTLTCDHRAVDGATGAAFLAALHSALEGTA